MLETLELTEDVPSFYHDIYRTAKAQELSLVGHHRTAERNLMKTLQNKRRNLSQ